MALFVHFIRRDFEMHDKGQTEMVRNNETRYAGRFLLGEIGYGVY